MALDVFSGGLVSAKIDPHKKDLGAENAPKSNYNKNIRIFNTLVKINDTNVKISIPVYRIATKS